MANPQGFWNLPGPKPTDPMQLVKVQVARSTEQMLFFHLSGLGKRYNFRALKSSVSQLHKVVDRLSLKIQKYSVRCKEFLTENEDLFVLLPEVHLDRV